MTRHQRQLDEMRSLCGSGRIGRAVDLAFEHFASFGRDEQVVSWLTDALEHGGGSAQTRRRLAELTGGDVGHDGCPGPPATG